MEYMGFQLQVSLTPEGNSTSLRDTQSVRNFFFESFQYKLGDTLYIAIHSLENQILK